jgi:hypothetical protein
MSRQIRQAVEKFGRDKVLVTSFTRAAAREIAGRDLGIEADTKMVGTLHSMCYHALGRPKIADTLAKEWNALNASTPSWCVSSGGVDIDDLGVSAESTSDGDALRAKANRWRSMLVPFRDWKDTPEGQWFQAWNGWMKEQNYTDFTGLIEKALFHRPVAPGDPAVAYVDEVQDMSPLELSLVREWSNSMQGIMLAGDPDQSIYGFKGASPRAFYEPEIPQEMYRVLGQGWRVPRAVHEFSVQWIKHATDHRPVKYEPREGDPGVVEVSDDPSEHFGLADSWIDDVLARVGDRSMMILASCSYMLVQAIKALRARGVPFHNPYRVSRGDWNPMRGGVERVANFMRPGEHIRPCWTWSELHSWIDLIPAKGRVKHGGKVLIEQKAKDAKTASCVIESGELSALLEPAFREQAINAIHQELQSWKWLEAQTDEPKRIEYALKICDRGGYAALTGKPKIIVGTIHSVKGGEADVVLMSPDLSPSGWQEFERQGDGHNGVRRLFYVGATRARQELLLASQGTSTAVSWQV